MSSVEDAKSASSATFVTALVFNAIVFAAELTAFTILRPHFKAIYEPRTYVPVPSKRIQPLCQSVLLWPLAVWNADYREIVRANGMDAYFFVRFLHMMVKVFLPIWFISWVVLLPVTSVNTRVGNNAGLDLFIFGNVANDKQKRYAAHIILVYIFTGWVFYNIKNEMRHFILMRQQHLISPAHAKSVQANTLLVTGIPTKYLNKEALLKLFDGLPGGVKKIWINRNLKDLPDIYDRRLAACNMLESAETTLLKTAAKLNLASNKPPPSPPPKDKAAPSIHSSSDTPDSNPTAPLAAGTNSANADVENSPTVGTKLVPKEKRPMHRLGWLPFMGEKVDTIEWAREEIRVCTELLEVARGIVERDHSDQREDKHREPEAAEGAVVEAEGEREEFASGGDKVGVDAEQKIEAAKKGEVGVAEAKQEDYSPLNSAFVTFRRQIATHMAMQVLTHHEPYRMSGKHVEVSPEDVIWGNLGLNPYEMKVRMLGSYAATAGLIILWAFPVAFVGIVSNVYALCKTAKFLAWICKLPDPVLGIISGILPPVMLAVLMMLLPIVLRLLAHFEGIPKRTGLELALMNRFFVFQVIHSFLIVSISAGIIAALPGLIKDPTSVPTLLAQNLPQASTFFLTYVILQGLAGTAGGFLQIVALVIYYVKLFILGSTPRSIHGIKYGARNVAWGTLFPGVTLLVVIALGYSIISPIINGLACATFFGFYQMYKYLFLWQFDQPASSDTGGLFFPKAIQHVFVGMYVQQVCLCALFFLARDQYSKASALAEGALMIVLIVFTALFQMMIRDSYGPLIHALPLTLADKTYGAPSLLESEQPDAEGSSKAPGDDASSSKKHSAEIRGDERDESALSKQKAPSEPAQDEVRSPSDLEDEYGFAHPALSRPQRTVWIPQDTLGLADEEQRACKEAGVDANLKHAEMDEKGKVDISGPPPDVILEE